MELLLDVEHDLAVTTRVDADLDATDQRLLRFPVLMVEHLGVDPSVVVKVVRFDQRAHLSKRHRLRSHLVPVLSHPGNVHEGEASD